MMVSPWFVVVCSDLADVHWIAMRKTVLVTGKIPPAAYAAALCSFQIAG
jgi:hypothetical protein